MPVSKDGDESQGGEKMQGIATSLLPLSQPLVQPPASTGTSSTAQTTAQSQTSLSISSESSLMNFISGGTRFDVSQSSLNVTLTASAEADNLEESTDAELRKLEFLLKSITKDPEEYERLKSVLTKQIKSAMRIMASMHGSAASRTSVASKVAEVQSQKISYQISMQISRVEARAEVQDVQVAMSDPLILDMGGDGIELTQAGSGAFFDINGDGRKESTAWVKGSSAFLVMDRNNNGTIDDGTELFGDQHGALHGFQELARFDSNSDSVINNRDTVFKALKVYQDMNGNGRIDSGEVTSLERAGVASINLDFTQMDSQKSGNSLILKGSFTTTDGSTRDIADALLGYRKTA
jgi:hypothetical protein